MIGWPNRGSVVCDIEERGGAAVEPLAGLVGLAGLAEDGGVERREMPHRERRRRRLAAAAGLARLAGGGEDLLVAPRGHVRRRGAERGRDRFVALLRALRCEDGARLSTRPEREEQEDVRGWIDGHGGGQECGCCCAKCLLGKYEGG